MNTEMAYLVGMILGNGEIQRGNRETTITIDIPYKNLFSRFHQLLVHGKRELINRN